ncbi:MAG: ribosome biogenesis GTP-binding protein YihA/YsxC [Patescibacteria group bacterium]
MQIKSVKFLKGIVGEDEIFLDPIPKIAFIGRSNVGKSSLINSLTNSSISRTSSDPGSTRQINVFLVNSDYHIVDLPGYGFARGSIVEREEIGQLIASYILNPKYTQKKVVLVIDGNVGMTDKDLSMFEDLESSGKNFVIAVSKIDKMSQADYHKKIGEIKELSGSQLVFPFSSKSKVGLEAISAEIFG